MVQTLTATQKPRISFNKLCEFPHVSPSARKRIAREQKFPADFQVSYYQAALNALVKATNLRTGRLDSGPLSAATAKLEGKPVEKKFQKGCQKNNIQAVRLLEKMASQIVLPPGEHLRVAQKATMEREGVNISVRPEFITYNRQLNTFAFTKFRFSKSPVSADAAETGVVLLLEFAKEERFAGRLLDLEHTTIIDVFSGTITYGHMVGRHRLVELNAALKELALIWPEIRPPGSRQNQLEGPAG